MYYGKRLRLRKRKRGSLNRVHVYYFPAKGTTGNDPEGGSLKNF